MFFGWVLVDVVFSWGFLREAGLARSRTVPVTAGMDAFEVSRPATITRPPRRPKPQLRRKTGCPTVSGRAPSRMQQAGSIQPDSATLSAAAERFSTVRTSKPTAIPRVIPIQPITTVAELNCGLASGNTRYWINSTMTEVA